MRPVARFALIACFGVPSFARAETPPRPGQNELGIWAGFAPGTATLIGTAEDRRLALLGLRYGRFLGRKGPVLFEYAADFLPAVIVLQPWFGRQFVQRPPVTPQNRGRIPVYGVGAAPVGFRFLFGRGRLTPFLGLSGGMVYSSEQIPIAHDTEQWNFMFDFGGGMQRFWPRGRSVFFGYKLHHISNANRGTLNPGLDSHVIYGGFSLVR